MRQPAAPSRGWLEAEQAGEASRDGLAGTRVLVVDDERDAREAITAVLEHNGADVVAVSSAGAALDAIERSVPDVVVSDIAMPGEDGYAFIRSLRGTAAGAHLPALSARRRAAG